MEVNKELNDEIWNYCRVNNITNIDEFILKCLKQGFTAEKFGATPTMKEKIVEVTVDKIVEVPVEKEVYITDDSQIKKLTKEIERLQKLKETYDIDQTNSHNEILKLIEKNKQLQKELEEEKKKNKTDFYGE